GVVAKNVQGTDQGLWAFLDLEDDTELGLHSFVVIDHLGFDLDLTKTVGLIKSFQVSNIRVEKQLAEAAVGEAPGRGLYLHSFPDQLLVKVFVSDDLDLSQLVARAGIDDVGNAEFILRRFGMFANADFGVEIAAGLKIVEQVSPAFVEQIVVETAFLINWNILFEYTARYSETFYPDVYNGAGIDLESAVHRIGFGVIGAFGNRDLGQ